MFRGAAPRYDDCAILSLGLDRRRQQYLICSFAEWRKPLRLYRSQIFLLLHIIFLPIIMTSVIVSTS